MTFLSRLALLAAMTLPATLLGGCFVDSSIGGAPCKPNETKDAGDGCNTCICQPNGQFSCTLMACGQGGGAGSSSVACQDESDCPTPAPCQAISCEAGKCVTSPVGNCPGNECQTTKDCVAPSGCDVVGCFEGSCQYHCDGAGCVPGTTKTADDGCNTCTCQKDGTFACTQLACPSGCTSNADCPQPDGCTQYVCQKGTCQLLKDPSCWGECQVDLDCPTNCQKCNGGEVCAQGTCEQGFCTEATFPPCGEPGPCDPQSAVGDGPCDAYFGYAWDGSQCVTISGCTCKGDDCDELFKTPEDCQKAHWNCPVGTNDCKTDSDCPQQCQTCKGTTVCAQSTCVGGLCSGPELTPCAPSVTPGGKCDEVGAKATADDGCNTCTCGSDHTWSCTEIACASTCNVNADCDSGPELSCLFCDGLNHCGRTYCETSVGEVGTCQTLLPSCGDSCTSQDIKGAGGCENVLGYAWLNNQCAPIIGCSCEGKDCSNMYKTRDACKAIHEGCATPL